MSPIHIPPNDVSRAERDSALSENDSSDNEKSVHEVKAQPVKVKKPLSEKQLQQRRNAAQSRKVKAAEKRKRNQEEEKKQLDSYNELLEMKKIVLTMRQQMDETTGSLKQLEEIDRSRPQLTAEEIKQLLDEKEKTREKPLTAAEIKTMLEEERKMKQLQKAQRKKQEEQMRNAPKPFVPPPNLNRVRPIDQKGGPLKRHFII